MSVINTGESFSNGEQLTADKLNQSLSEATFGTDAFDGTSIQLTDVGSKLGVRDLGVSTAKLANNAVTTAKIENANVTFAKLTDVIDDDTMATASATTLATSESIKAYVDEYLLKYSGSTGTINSTTSFQDLDLSSVIGANRALVVLEFVGGTQAVFLFTRTNGSSVLPYRAANFAGWGSSSTVTSATIGGTVIVTSDANGVIEYKSGAASNGISYTVQAYQKLA